MVNSNVYKTQSAGMVKSVCQTFSAWPCNSNDYKTPDIGPVSSNSYERASAIVVNSNVYKTLSVGMVNSNHYKTRVGGVISSEYGAPSTWTVNSNDYKTPDGGSVSSNEYEPTGTELVNQLVLSWLTLKTKVPATVMVNDPLKHKTLKKTNACTWICVCNCTA